MRCRLAGTLNLTIPFKLPRGFSHCCLKPFRTTSCRRYNDAKGSQLYPSFLPLGRECVLCFAGVAVGKSRSRHSMRHGKARLRAFGLGRNFGPPTTAGQQSPEKDLLAHEMRWHTSSRPSESGAGAIPAPRQISQDRLMNSCARLICLHLFIAWATSLPFWKRPSSARYMIRSARPIHHKEISEPANALQRRQLRLFVKPDETLFNA